MHGRCQAFSPGGGGAKGQGMWGQILAMKGLLMNAWTITGGGGQGQGMGGGAAAPR